MKYMGSKNRIAKEILPIILKDRKPEQWYVEPFVGGANLIDKVAGKRIGADLNRFVIKALKLIRDNPSGLPKNNKSYTEEDFLNSRAKKTEDLTPIDCFALFNYSFSSIWRGSFAKNRKGDDYVAQGFNSAAKQSKGLQGVMLINCGYAELDIPKSSIIYCDPPYAGTATYKGLEPFDSVAFWDWARQKSLEGHTVFVSEYEAPPDFDCVWSKELSQSLGGNKRATEKLFIFNDLY